MDKQYRTGQLYRSKGFFGSWLAEKLIANECTYADIAKAIGINHGSLSRYVSMRSHPSYRVVKQICIFFDEPNSEAIYQKVLDDIESEKDIPEHRLYDNNRFGGWLKKELAERNLTMTSFAKDIRISKNTICDHLSEKRYPRRHAVERYAEYFGVDVTDIYDRILYSKQYHRTKGEFNASPNV